MSVDYTEASVHAAAVVALVDPMVAALTDAYTAEQIAALDVSAFPYAVVHIGSPQRSSERLAKAAHRLDFYPRVTVVGLDKDQCLAAAAVVGQSLALRRPSVAGRVCSLVEHVGRGEALRDADNPKRVIWSLTESWHFVSTAAAMSV